MHRTAKLISLRSQKKNNKKLSSLVNKYEIFNILLDIDLSDLSLIKVDKRNNDCPWVELIYVNYIC